MFIARMKTITKDKTVAIKTFSFETEKDLDEALYHLKRCGTPLFAAEVHSKESSSGRLIGKWNERKDPVYWAGYTTERGPYKDHRWVHFGTEEECAAWAKETNDKGVSRFCTFATKSHVVGDLWRIDYCTPYND